LSQGGETAKEVDAGGRRVAAAALVAEVAGVAATRDEQDTGLGAPAVLGAGAERFVELAQRAEARIRREVGFVAPVVVAVVGGGALVDAPVLADANLD